MKIYLASSWRNPLQPTVVKLLRTFDHEVYDFRNPEPATGFQWSQCGGNQADLKTRYLEITDSLSGYLQALSTERAKEGFTLDKTALDWCDACVLLLPCGRSAHLEAGYAAGRGKLTYVLLNEVQFEPELMYLLCTNIFTSIEQLLEALKK